MASSLAVCQSVQALATQHKVYYCHWGMCNSSTKIRASRHVELRSLETAVGRACVVFCILVRLRCINTAILQFCPSTTKINIDGEIPHPQPLSNPTMLFHRLCRGVLRQAV